MFATTRRAVLCVPLAILFAVVQWAIVPARAADAIKVGFSMALTGAVAPNGKQNLLALEIWRDALMLRGRALRRSRSSGANRLLPPAAFAARSLRVCPQRLDAATTDRDARLPARRPAIARG
jgi:hypothetical protein